MQQSVLKTRGVFVASLGALCLVVLSKEVSSPVLHCCSIEINLDMTSWKPENQGECPLYLFGVDHAARVVGVFCTFFTVFLGFPLECKSWPAGAGVGHWQADAIVLLLEKLFWISFLPQSLPFQWFVNSTRDGLSGAQEAAKAIQLHPSLWQRLFQVSVQLSFKLVMPLWFLAGMTRGRGGAMLEICQKPKATGRRQLANWLAGLVPKKGYFAHFMIL